MSGYGSSRRAYRPPRSGVSSAVTALLIVLGMLVLFVAGFYLANILRGSDGGGGGSPTPAPTSGSPTQSQSGSASPQPCTTVTVVPGENLPAPGDVSVNVYNSTDRTGLAAATAEVLKGRGFVIASIANDPLKTPLAGVAEIRYGIRSERAAKLMSYYLPGSELINDNRKGTDIDVSLGRQFQTVASQSEIDKALAQPTPSPSGPGCSSSAVA